MSDMDWNRCPLSSESAAWDGVSLERNADCKPIGLGILEAQANDSEIAHGSGKATRLGVPFRVLATAYPSTVFVHRRPLKPFQAGVPVVVATGLLRSPTIAGTGRNALNGQDPGEPACR